jgi:hypothetical protein
MFDSNFACFGKGELMRLMEHRRDRLVNFAIYHCCSGHLSISDQHVNVGSMVPVFTTTKEW